MWLVDSLCSIMEVSASGGRTRLFLFFERILGIADIRTWVQSMFREGLPVSL